MRSLQLDMEEPVLRVFLSSVLSCAQRLQRLAVSVLSHGKGQFATSGEGVGPQLHTLALPLSLTSLSIACVDEDVLQLIPAITACTRLTSLRLGFTKPSSYYGFNPLRDSPPAALPVFSLPSLRHLALTNPLRTAECAVAMLQACPSVHTVSFEHASLMAPEMPSLDPVLHALSSLKNLRCVKFLNAFEYVNWYPDTVLALDSLVGVTELACESHAANLVIASFPPQLQSFTCSSGVISQLTLAVPRVRELGIFGSELLFISVLRMADAVETLRVGADMGIQHWKSKLGRGEDENGDMLRVLNAVDNGYFRQLRSLRIVLANSACGRDQSAAAAVERVIACVRKRAAEVETRVNAAYRNDRRKCKQSMTLTVQTNVFMPAARKSCNFVCTSIHNQTEWL